VFLLLEDEFGLANVIVKPKLYEASRSLIRTEPLLLVYGELQRREGITNVLADDFRALRASRSLVAPPAHNFR
jgi:error-prone DNA polymerase